jgi:cell division protein FtsB
MRYGNKPLYERIAGSPAVLLVLLIILVLLGKAAWNIHEKARTADIKLSEASDQLAKLQESQRDLSAKVAYLSTDQGVEAEMRTKWKAVKAGESVAVIVDDSQQAAAGAASSTPSGGWWGAVLRFLGL